MNKVSSVLFCAWLLSSPECDAETTIVDHNIIGSQHPATWCILEWDLDKRHDLRGAQQPPFEL